jgi:hypothetical protein
VLIHVLHISMVMTETEYTISKITDISKKEIRNRKRKTSSLVSVLSCFGMVMLLLSLSSSSSLFLSSNLLRRSKSISRSSSQYYSSTSIFANSLVLNNNSYNKKYNYCYNDIKSSKTTSQCTNGKLGPLSKYHFPSVSVPLRTISRLLSSTTATTSEASETTKMETELDTTKTITNMSSDTLIQEQQQNNDDVIVTTTVEVLGNENDFIKPDRDERQYRWIKLSNNLQVLLVSTSESSTSSSDNTNTRTGMEAASVHVQAGHMDDTIPGLARTYRRID